MSDARVVSFNGHIHISVNYDDIQYVLRQWPDVPIPNADPRLGGSIRIGQYCTILQVWGRDGKVQWTYYHSAETGRARMIYTDSEDPTKNETLWARNFKNKLP